MKKAFIFIMVLILSSCNGESNTDYEKIRESLSGDIVILSADGDTSFTVKGNVATFLTPPSLSGIEIHFDADRMEAKKYGYEIHIPKSFCASVCEICKSLLALENNGQYQISQSGIEVGNCFFSINEDSIIIRTNNKHYTLKRRTENGTYNSIS